MSDVDAGRQQHVLPDRLKFVEFNLVMPLRQLQFADLNIQNHELAFVFVLSVRV